MEPQEMLKEINDLQKRFTEYTQRFARALDLMAEVKFTEDGNVIVEDDWFELMESVTGEIFLEDKNTEKAVVTQLGRMIEHLLKLGFSTSDYHHGNWSNTVDRHQGDVIDILDWLDKPDINLVKHARENLSKSYRLGIGHYKRDSKEYEDLVPGLNKIPSECPWTLEQLLDDTTKELVSVLAGL